MIYELEVVTKRFGAGDGWITALDRVDLTIDAGECLAVTGPSGSGKSTLLLLLGGLDRPSAGWLRFEGQDLGELPDRDLARLRLETFGFVFQRLNLIPTLTAQQNVEAALAPLAKPAAERRARAAELLEEVGRSAGERQRVAIARALANEPRVLFADEPSGATLSLLRRLSEERGQTLVLATRDRDLAAGADRVVQMRDGRIEATGDPAGLLVRRPA